MIFERTKSEIDRYVNDGCVPGSFVYAVLSNQFLEAFNRADDENLFNMIHIARYVHMEIPGNCHGSEQKVEDYLRLKREEKNANSDKKGG